VAYVNPLRVELGQRVRLFRERARVLQSAVDADPELEWYEGKTSKVETGTRTVGAAEVRRLAVLFKLSDNEMADLLALAKGARKRTRVPHVADFARNYVLLEQEATQIDYHDEVLIPAVLQTEGYARDLLARTGVADLDERIDERLTRGRLLAEPGAPVLRAVLGEAALHRLPVDHAVAAEQLRHLDSMGQLPNVHLRVLPFAAGLHELVGTGFTILRLATPAITRVYLEGATAATYLHEPAETDVYVSWFERLWAIAADEDSSATILRRRILQVG